MEILEGYRRRTGGEVTVLGRDPRHGGASWRARIGVVLQESEPERDLTASECLQMYAGYYPGTPATLAGRQHAAAEIRFSITALLLAIG